MKSNGDYMDWRAAFYFDDTVSMCMCVFLCVCKKRKDSTRVSNPIAIPEDDLIPF